MLVSVRVGFQLDAEADDAESWHVYGPEGRMPWPCDRVTHHAYVGVGPRTP